MAISDDLFSAILAMDAYNRGVVDPKLIVTGPIGDATLLASSPDERSEIRGLHSTFIPHFASLMRATR